MYEYNMRCAEYNILLIKPSKQLNITNSTIPIHLIYTTSTKPPQCPLFKALPSHTDTPILTLMIMK